VEPIAITLPPDLRILVVEDHPRNQQVMQIMLEGLGASAICSGNGLEGLELRRSKHFDLILMDMQMPDVDGLTATRMIRAYEHATGLPRTPIIMVTANASPEHVAQALEAGCQAHLAKPVVPETLCRAMAEVLGRARNSAEA
jgi:CheY-like chemotaxis protein